MSTTLANPPTLFDPAEVARALELFMPAGEVVEIRILGATLAGDRRQHSVVFGYFDDHAKLVEALESVHSATGFYFTLNAVNPALLARAHNRLRPAGKGGTTNDGDVVARCWLPIDTDAKRPAGISATDDEHDAALLRSRQIADWLTSVGWPAPIVADSGNGGHLCYAIDLPSDDGGLIQRCLEALAARFNDASVKVDTAVFNPARIWKLYGTLAAKGDPTADRPHRLAKLLDVPEALTVVTRQQLESLAAEAPKPEAKPAAPSLNGHAGSFDLDIFIGRCLPGAKGPSSWKGSGRSWELPQSPMCDHHDGAAWLAQQPSGAIAAGCQHESCKWGWPDLRQKLEPRASRNGDHRDSRATRTMPNPADVASITVEDVQEELPKPINIRQLISDHPRLHEPIIDGLLRRGETANIIAPAKVGKSWLSYQLALMIATGGDWLGRFECRPGKVLIIDNELHPETAADRIPKSAFAAGVSIDKYGPNLDVISLRGRLLDLYGIARILELIPPGAYDLIILDAWYRALPDGFSENDNASVAALYNKVDQITARLNCCWINIHHCSKGEQGQKAITDVGSGAGSQSRAADAHIILRPHEENDAVVLDAVVRSFKPIEPLSLRWEFPLWTPDDCLDTSAVRGRLTKQEERINENNQKAIKNVSEALFKGPATPKILRGRTGMSDKPLQRILDLMESQEIVVWTPISERGNETREYQLTTTDD